MEKEIDKYCVALLSKATEPPTNKQDKLDEQIATQISDPHELKSLIVKCKELKTILLINNPFPA